MNVSLPYRWNIFFRILIAAGGGMFVASFCVAVIATLFPAHKALATYSGMLLSFVIWLLMALFAFTKLPKKNGFRQSMSWLHTWTGLVVGWILFFIFVTGTASYANREITRWMQPERPMESTTARSAATQFGHAIEALRAHPDAARATNWTVDLVSNARTSSQLTARWSNGNAEQRGGNSPSIVLDVEDFSQAAPSEAARQTAGGRALLRMHYALHYMPYGWAVRIVGICTMLMFIAIITGVITHKKIFSDFFTFRPGKGQRSWLDAHNLISVISLPFYLMITYSGLLFFLYAYLPLGVPFAYGFEQEKQQAYYAELAQETASQRLIGRMAERTGGGGGGGQQGANAQRQVPQGMGNARPGGGAATPESTGPGPQEMRAPSRVGGARPEQNGNSDRSGGNSRGEVRPTGDEDPMTRRGLGAQSARYTDIVAIVERTERQWGHGEIRSVVLTTGRGPDAPPVLQLAPAWGDSLRRGGNSPNLQFNAYTGEEIVSPQRATPPLNERIAAAMIGLHEGLFARPLLRWLYLLAGLLGCAMIASGLVLWTVKRRPTRESGGFHLGHSLVEKLNIATVAGLPLGLAVYFWANRLLPVDLADRAQWEIHALFIAWLLSLAYALARPLMHAWREMLILTSASWFLLPVLNAITTNKHLLAALTAGDWVLVSVETVFIGVGLVFAWAAWKVHTKMQAPARRPRRKARGSAPETQTSKESIADDEVNT